MTLETYTDPVARLLTYGDCRQLDDSQWPDYVAELGLSSEDIPELIRMATDPGFNTLESDRIEVRAPAHAWRSLGQLKAEAAIEPLTTLFAENDDWVLDDLPTVYAMMGPVAIAPLSQYLADSTHEPLARSTAAHCLREIARTHPEHRAECITPLVKQLEACEDNGVDLTTLLISDLMDLKAVEAAPVIKKAFTADCVEEFIVGSWPAVQIELGLKSNADFSAEELKPKIPEELLETMQFMQTIEEQSQESQVQQSQGFGAKTQQNSKKQTKKKKK